jgi:methylglyoxal synthase
MKTDLADWAVHNRTLLARHRVYATGTTGQILKERLAMPVHLFLSGPLGGDQQIGAGIAQGTIDALIFFWDPLEPQPHDPDVKALLRIATLWNIPVASNRTTADMIVTSPLFTGAYTPILPSFLRNQEAELARSHR